MSGAGGQLVTETVGKKPDVPSGVNVGDFLVARYTHSEWAPFWENWHHAGLVVELDPLKVVEATGLLLQQANKKLGLEEVREGVVEYEFKKQRQVRMLNGSIFHGNLYLDPKLVELLWCQPVFPNPLREIDDKKVWWRRRQIITQDDARSRVVRFARDQIGEHYSLKTSKRSEKLWYCSKLPYKAYSRTVTGFYLESGIPGPFVTPEDLVDSKRSRVYHRWLNERYS